MASPFEIRIAVLGYVSAGKTTVINALLRDMYGQVGMRRVTAGVNYFRLHHHPTVGGGKDPRADGGNGKGRDPGTLNGVQGSKSSKDRKKKSKAQGQSDAAPSDAMNRGVVIEERKEDAEGWIAEDEFSPAAKTLDEISKDNVALRESSFVKVKTFDISISEPLCEVRPDTRLVLVDIPGINEAGADGKYRAYVREHWDTFDCALVVLDGRQGANTEEQVELLEFVRDNNAEMKDIPTIIVCNKVDDPEDQEQVELVTEVKEEVTKVFAYGAMIPVFVPMSAEFAYIYRAAALMSFEQFREFDVERIDRLGRKEMGWRFSKLPLEEKLRLAYQALTDESLFADRIRATNFDVLLQAIAELVGGSDTQLKLIEKQIVVELERLSPEECFVDKIRAVFHKRQALGRPTDDLPSHFWTIYKWCEHKAFCSFAKSPSNVKVIAKPVKDLVEYYAFAKAQGLTDELVKCLSGLKSLTVRQIETVLDEEAKAMKTWASRESSAAVRWGSLNPCEWLRICQSFLLLSHFEVFSEEFGREIMSLEDCKHKWTANSRAEPSAFGFCPKCRRSSLDFNGFCHACHVFVYSSDCSLFNHLSTTPTPRPRCFYCQHQLPNLKYCNCDKKYTPTLIGGYVASASNSDSLTLFCRRMGCSQKLNANRACAGCKVIYCLKGRPQSRFCMFCSDELNLGRCASSSCVGNKFTWSELPFDSMIELLPPGIQTKYPELYGSVVHLDVPAKLSDPSHFGHVAWRYCQFVKSLDWKHA